MKTKKSINFKEEIYKLEYKKETLLIDMENIKIFSIKNKYSKESDINRMLYIFLKNYKHIIGQKIIDYKKIDLIVPLKIEEGVGKILVNDFLFNSDESILIQEKLKTFDNRDIYKIIYRMKKLFSNKNIIKILNNFSKRGIIQSLDNNIITKFELFLFLEEDGVKIFSKWEKSSIVTRRKYISNYITVIFDKRKKSPLKRLFPNIDRNGNYIINKRIMNGVLS